MAILPGTQVIFPDTLADMRAWLRANSLLQPLHQGRVFFRLPDFLFSPKDAQASTPAIRLYRHGGGPRANSEVPIDDARLTLECWVGAPRQYASLRQLVLAVTSVLHDLPSASLPLNPPDGCLLLNAQVSGTIDAPDPETGWPRVVMSMTASTIASGSTI